MFKLDSNTDWALISTGGSEPWMLNLSLRIWFRNKSLCKLGCYSHHCNLYDHFSLGVALLNSWFNLVVVLLSFWSGDDFKSWILNDIYHIWLLPMLYHNWSQELYNQLITFSISVLLKFYLLILITLIYLRDSRNNFLVV